MQARLALSCYRSNPKTPLIAQGTYCKHTMKFWSTIHVLANIVLKALQNFMVQHPITLSGTICVQHTAPPGQILLHRALQSHPLLLILGPMHGRDHHSVETSARVGHDLPWGLWDSQAVCRVCAGSRLWKQQEKVWISARCTESQTHQFVCAW